jgi:hypothetical protein
MSVHISKYSNFMGFAHGNKNAKLCTLCNGVLHYPFLEWESKLFLCSRCCKKIKRGLTADLIHINAILDLRAEGYNSLLVRQSEERHRALLEAENELCKQKVGMPKYEWKEDK